MSINRDRAVALMQHYFSLCAARTGNKWDSDNNIEVEEMVDAIIDAAREERPTAHAAAVEQLRAGQSDPRD